MQSISHNHSSEIALAQCSSMLYCHLYRPCDGSVKAVKIPELYPSGLPPIMQPDAQSSILFYWGSNSFDSPFPLPESHSHVHHAPILIATRRHSYTSVKLCTITTTPCSTPFIRSEEHRFSEKRAISLSLLL